ncbi:DUF6093 family protein [Streptomyces harbinensis]|uniref:DUF6093 family protein n=1 Tax=Streptomyces harbinensis TaxID=1176198 RepID=UPI00367B0FB8
MYVATALSAGRAAADQIMPDTIRLHRPGEEVWDRETGTAQPGPDLVLYEGIARVKVAQLTTNEVQSGEQEVMLRQYRVAVPFAAIPAARVERGDIVLVLTSPDPRLGGLRLWVSSVHYSATATAWRIIAEDRS